MTARHYFRGPDQQADLTETDITERFRLYAIQVTSNAEEGSVGTSSVIADNDDGTFEIVGHRRYRIAEDAASGSNATMYVGYTAERSMRRGDFHRVGATGETEITLVDINSVLGRRVVTGEDANRPAETDVARVAWALTTNEASLIDDDLYVTEVDGVAMDAADYRGQEFLNIIDDCAQQSGRNYFVWYREETEEYSLWYDFAASSNYTSPLRLSNVLADVDSTWTYAISVEDTDLSRDPSRTYSGVYVPYNGGYVYVQRQSTADTYAQRDAIMPAENVSTAAKANARANRYLNDLSSEEDTITTSYLVPAAKVNFLMQGMRVQIKATHLSGYEDWQWMRCVSRTVIQTSEDYYTVRVELSAPAPAPEVLPVYAILRLSKGPFTTDEGANLVYWGFPGDTPSPGYPLQPTTGALEILTDESPPSTWAHPGIKVTGTGTIDVTYFATFAGVLVSHTDYTVTWAIAKNGTIVASEAGVYSGALQYISSSKTVTVSALSVEPDDVITAVMTCSPSNMPFFRTPAGTGQHGERLEITGGSLS